MKSFAEKIKYGQAIALIPARSGSKSIRNKNIADVCGFPLVAYSIAAAKLCPSVERVVVSTNSEEYAVICRKYGAEVPFLRPDSLSGDCSQDIEYLKHALEELLRTENQIPEQILLLRPTTPLRNPLDLEDILKTARLHPEASAIVSVSKTDICPYKWMKINEKGYLVSPFSELSPDDVNLPRQSFPPMLIPDGYADVIKSETVLGEGNVYGYRAVPWNSPPEVIDVDMAGDLETLRTGSIADSEVYQYLQKQQTAAICGEGETDA